MAAHGLAERRATAARLTNAIQPVGDRVYRGAIPDDEDIPRDASGRVLPHIVIDFGAPVKAARDRNIANPELSQPHVLPANVLCVAGDADTADAVMAAVMNLLVDWKPSDTADAWEAKGGYGTNRPSTGNTPTRYGSGLFLECVVNQDAEEPEAEPDDDDGDDEEEETDA